MKSNTSIVLDIELKAEAKTRGLNLSDLLNNLLKVHLGQMEKATPSIKEKKQLDADVAKQEAKLAELKQRKATVDLLVEKEKTREKEYWE